MDASLLLTNLLAPPILFFLLGVVASLVRADLEFPQPVTRALSLYLLFSIGLHGGCELAQAGIDRSVLAPLLGAVVASATIPLLVFLVLRRRLGADDAAAIAATYGSISAVTFITACSFLDASQVSWSGTMVAAMALMESPAILIGVVLARPSSGGALSGSFARLTREAFLNGPVFLLLGSLGVGLLAGEEGWAKVAPFAHEPFQGVLCLFLLDMGLLAARRLDTLRSCGAFVIAFALVAPFAQAAVGIGLAYGLDLELGDALLLTVLCASASYIAVPAAMRIVLPQANPSLYLPMALGLTFPLNVALGIPIYMTVLRFLWSPV